LESDESLGDWFDMELLTMTVTQTCVNYLPGELCLDSVNDSQTSNETNVATTQDTKQGPDVDQVYTEAKQLIDLTEELKTAPERLSNQCEQLETLAQELTESINALKQQARSVPARTGS